MKPTKYVAAAFHKILGTHFNERDARIVQRVIEEDQFLSVATEFELSPSQVSKIFHRKVRAMMLLSRTVEMRDKEIAELRSSAGRHPVDEIRNRYPKSIGRFLGAIEKTSGIKPTTWEQAFSMASMMHRDAKVLAFLDYAKAQMGK